MPRGGRRPGAGRKKKISTIIREKALQEANDDAKYGLGTLVAYMRDESQPPAFRVDCAKAVMDRVWGRPKQQVDATVTGGVNIYMPDNGRDD